MDTLGPYELNTIVTGDARELAQAIPDESVDLVVCDPVYSDIAFYEYVASESLRVLVSGCSCVVQLGQYFLPDVLACMSKHLDYYWIDSQRLGVNSRMWSKKIFVNWKPFLWLWKPCSSGRLGNWAVDSMYAPPDKHSHEWGDGWQAYARVIQDLTSEGGTVLDFCTGGGTVPAVCKMLGRNYIAFEIDPDTADKARARVANTQPPLFVIQAEQSTFDFGDPSDEMD